MRIQEILYIEKYGSIGESERPEYYDQNGKKIKYSPTKIQRKGVYIDYGADYRAFEDDQPLFTIPNAYDIEDKDDPAYAAELKKMISDDPFDRPPNKIFRYAGRAFEVCYYHDGSPEVIWEIDS